MKAPSMYYTHYYDARKRLKLRKGPFAKAIGIGRESARAYEAGSKPIPQVVALAIAALLLWEAAGPLAEAALAHGLAPYE